MKYFNRCSPSANPLIKAVQMFPISRMVLLAGCALGQFASAEDWNQFRGPNGNAISNASNSPESVSQSNVAWKTAIPGTGWSSPVVSGNRIWITTAETTAATSEQIAAKTRGVQFAKIKTVAGSVRFRAICVDASNGQIIHNLSLLQVNDPDLINPLNSYASPTAAIAGQHVICHFGSYGTWCIDQRSGTTVWQNRLVVDHSVGPGSSPIVSGNRVILVCDGIDQQFVAGLDLETGQQAWKTNRPEIRSTNGEYRKAYSTPLLIELGGQKQAVIPGAQWVCAYDPQSGKELWRADYGEGFSTTPMAIYESGLLICSTGYMKGELFAIKPTGNGNLTNNIVWRSAKGGSKMPTAVASKGRIYSISDDGILSTLNANNGTVEKRQRIGGKFAASPLLVADKLYLGNQNGELIVLRVGSDGIPQKMSTSQLDGTIMSSPAVVGSDLVIRTGKSLMRVRGI